MIIVWISIGNFLIFRIYDFRGVTLGTYVQEWMNNYFLEKLQLHSHRFFSEQMSGSLVSSFRKGISAFEELSDIFGWQVLPFVSNVLIILIFIALQSFWIA